MRGYNRPMDRICLNEMVFYGYHGVLPEEQALGQRFVVDVEMRLDLRPAGEIDDLSFTVNYSDVYADVRDVVTGPSFELIEAVAERIAKVILADHPSVVSVLVRVRKPHVPLAGAVLASAEVCIERDRQGII